MFFAYSNRNVYSRYTPRGSKNTNLTGGDGECGVGTCRSAGSNWLPNKLNVVRAAPPPPQSTTPSFATPSSPNDCDNQAELLGGLHIPRQNVLGHLLPFPSSFIPTYTHLLSKTHGCRHSSYYRFYRANRKKKKKSDLEMILYFSIRDNLSDKNWKTAEGGTAAYQRAIGDAVSCNFMQDP